ncbi:hypothetical protein E2R68_04815 [Psychromonas sp. RZ22]|uniref:CehA/McbA family metallohydrolase n=1 Tax=Psychromonas algarum TaxID=2555643 RepID=UPI001067B22A|nr:CehA/McbA family metallohydrolase [Psychromonas sp. RZ22]TEW55702.1 hypothetical protein E2R68_04815 [Psychromonas sp. RZ22]
MLNFNGELTFGHRVLNFNVRANIKTLTITATTIKKGFLYAYLYDCEQQLRANLLFEKESKKLILTEQSASLGGIPGPLPAGDWQLHLYNLEGENRSPKAMRYSVDIEDSDIIDSQHCSNEKLLATKTQPCINVNSINHHIDFDYDYCVNKEPRWYRGDLHAHTQLSDGHNSLASAVNIAEQQSLDFFFITEHNICHPALPISERTLILPAIEVTTDQGHFNVHGPRQSLNMLEADYSSAALIEQGINLVAIDEGNISINHPMMKPWHWQYPDIPLNKINTLEVCCDPTWSSSPKATEEALALLTHLWNAGYRIAAVGGSDSHLAPHERNPNAIEASIYGDPSTFVYADWLSGNAILSGLRQGHVYIERQCGLVFNINDGALLPGQDAENNVVEYALSVNDSQSHYFAECIADGEIIARYQLSAETILFNVDMKNHGWLRVDIRRGQLNVNNEKNNAEFEGLINPIYNGQNATFSHPLIGTWGELTEMIKENEE